MNIYVFKTSIEPKDVRTVDRILHALIPNGIWNYDLEDCDRILRIESGKDIVELVCFEMAKDGFYCEELE